MPEDLVPEAPTDSPTPAATAAQPDGPPDPAKAEPPPCELESYSLETLSAILDP
jgi:hypothetical protein